MRSISHWGLFGDFDREIPAPHPYVGPSASRFAAAASQMYHDLIGNHDDWSRVMVREVSAADYDQKYLHGQQDYQLYFNQIPGKSGH